MKRRAFVYVFAVFLLIMLINFSAGVYLDWLWFSQLGLAGVFQTILASAWAVKLAAWIIFALFLFLNLSYTQKAILDMPNLVLRQTLMNTSYGNLLTKRRIGWLFLVASLLISWLATAAFSGEWLTVRLFVSGSSMGVTDPIFSKDAAFYLFSLPFFELVYQYLFTLFVITILFCGAVYLLVQPPQQLGLRTLFVRRGAVHLSLLFAAAFLLRAVGYRLQMYGLMHSGRGAVFGPGYTDIHAYLPAYWILLALALIAALVMLFNIKVKSTRLITGSIIALFLASVVLNGILPTIVQKFVVEPNEFVREEPYLSHNIEFTQKAYGLDQIEEREFNLTGTLGYEELTANEGTLSNIRLWDWRPLQQTYNQLQGLRQYYRFNDVDTDRYVINGKMSQFMLSARELVQSQLTAPTWVNTRLSYTHGYGAVASPVNEVTSQGLPQLAVRDFPVEGEAELKIDVPQIYYGELTDSYIFTNTDTDEFDYPKGETNAFMRYEGTGGVPLGGFMRRSLFALHFADYRILVSGELSSDSRIHYKRVITQRVQEAFPFLQYDEDPYLVVADGRLYWIIDAYTTTRLYPYAEQYKGINYIRNSVKVTVDAYNGDVRFYVFEPDDPFIKAYNNIFPDVFLAAGQMPETLRAHIRYPEYLFDLQSEVYAAYHMNNRKVFYNKEDRWQTPQENYGGNTIPMSPYYTVLQLPQEEEVEFVLMRPYTMYNRDNMVAWLAGRSDGDKYGQLIAYQFPKGELLYGPAQVEARIDQDSAISQQLSLWDQRGSSVIRGNLLVLPVNGSILYVEPVYLRAQQSELPELVRVIVAYGDQIVMENSLEEALAAVFGLQPDTSPGDPTEPDDSEEPDIPEIPVEPGDEGIAELIERAAALFYEAEAALREGDWAEYGRLQDELGSILSRMESLSSQEPVQEQQSLE